MKLCECGCGQEVKQVSHTCNKVGKKKGEFNRFIAGHHLKVLKKTEEHKRNIGQGNFKGGIIIKKGYRYIYTKGHPYPYKIKETEYVLEHRLIMKKHLGRYLTPKEIVHHINGDIQNNVLSNLMLLPNQAAHVKYHFIEKLKGGLN